ncbi:MAG: Asp-tRNA(Asn)/Glu-tRNA(Gln) amidotransferase subunit GatA [Anaerolineae bacterium]
MLNLHELTIHRAHQLLRGEEISSVELTEAVLERIEAVEDDVRAYLNLTPDLALKDAEAADARRARGEDHPLLGIPLAIKDVLSTKDVETTCGSRILEGYMPPFDATCVARLRRAGAVFLGKTNTDEFAMGSSTENSGYFTTHNPWELGHVPGGSSGGSAAAVAADECIAALGTDTGGSIRQPAAFCGVAGLKPTYGRVSRYGLVAFASSLDQAGPLCKDVRDCAILLRTMAGHDSQDSTSVDLDVPDYAEALRPDLEGARLGVPKEYFVEGMQPGLEERVRAALEMWEELGAEIVEVSMPHTEYALPTYYIIAPAEASANLARYDGVRYGFSHPEAENIWDAYRKTRQEGFGAEVKRRIMLGTYALSAGYYDAYYLKAQKVRTLIKDDFDQAFETCDALVAPTTPTTAFRIGEKTDDPLQMYLGDIFTLSLNLAGVCGMSIPCGFIEGMPVGLQVFGDAYDESTVLRIGYAYEQATDWHMRRPPI